AGLWFAPLSGAAAWTLVFGLGQGASLGLAIYFTAARAPDPVTSASLSAFTQGAGYLVATAGPLAVGFLHAVTGTWTVPVLVLLGVLAGQGAVGWQAGRARTLPAPPRAEPPRAAPGGPAAGPGRGLVRRAPPALRCQPRSPSVCAGRLWSHPAPRTPRPGRARSRCRPGQSGGINEDQGRGPAWSGPGL